MHSLASIEIDRPIAEVFAYTNEKVAEWSLTVVEDEVIEDKNGVGTTFLCVTEEKGRRMEFQGVVTLWEPPTKSAISLTGKTFDIEAEYRFEDLNGRTRVTQESTQLQIPEATIANQTLSENSVQARSVCQGEVHYRAGSFQCSSCRALCWS